MALGSAKVQQRFENPREILGERLKEGSIYRLLADHGHTMFPDDYFADLYSDSVKGRPTIAARVMATVMLLQAFEGLSDREATDRLEVDLRWQAACGVDVGCEAFHPTALVGQRNRLRASKRPRRLFEDTKVVAKATGAMKGRARVLDSTPVFDAVATEDTVTQLRAAIRKLLGALDQAASPLASRPFCETTTTPRRASPRAIGTTERLVRRWSTPWFVTPWAPSVRSTAKRSRHRPPPPSNCSPWWPAKTSNKETTGSFASCGGWPRTG